MKRTSSGDGFATGDLLVGSRTRSRRPRSTTPLTAGSSAASRRSGEAGARQRAAHDRSAGRGCARRVRPRGDQPQAGHRADQAASLHARDAPDRVEERPAVWEALLEHMPQTALLRNLGKMTAIGLLSPMSDASRRVAAIAHRRRGACARPGSTPSPCSRPSRSMSRATASARSPARQRALVDPGPRGRRRAERGVLPRVPGGRADGEEAPPGARHLRSMTQRVSIARRPWLDAARGERSHGHGDGEDRARVRRRRLLGGVGRLRRQVGRGRLRPHAAVDIAGAAPRRRAARGGWPPSAAPDSRVADGLGEAEPGRGRRGSSSHTDNETWAGGVHPFQALREYRAGDGPTGPG